MMTSPTGWTKVPFNDARDLLADRETVHVCIQLNWVGYGFDQWIAVRPSEHGSPILVRKRMVRRQAPDHSSPEIKLSPDSDWAICYDSYSQWVNKKAILSMLWDDRAELKTNKSGSLMLSMKV